MRVEPAGDARRGRRRRQDAAGARGRSRARRRVPGRRVVRRSGLGRATPRRSRRRSRPRWESARAGHSSSSTRSPRHCRAGAPWCWSTTASTSCLRPSAAIGVDPRQVAGRPGPRDVSRVPVDRRRDVGGGRRRWHWKEASRPTRPSCSSSGPARCGPGSVCTTRTTAAAVTEICQTLDGLPLGIELAAARMAAMSAIEVRDRLGARFRLLHGPAARPERQQTLLRAVGWSYDLLDADEQMLMRNVSRVLGRVRPGEHHGGRRTPTTSTSLGSSTRSSASRCRRRPRRRPHALPDVRDDPPVRRGPADRDRRPRRGCATGTPRTSPARPRRAGSDGTDRAGATPSTGSRPSSATSARAFRWSAGRGQMEVATDIAAHAALMGFSVELFETVSWAEELLEPAAAAAVPRLPRLYTGSRLRLLRRARRGGDGQRPPRRGAGVAARVRPLRARATRPSSRRSARSTADTSTATSS